MGVFGDVAGSDIGQAIQFAILSPQMGVVLGCFTVFPLLSRPALWRVLAVLLVGLVSVFVNLLIIAFYRYDWYTVMPTIGLFLSSGAMFWRSGPTLSEASFGG